MKQVFLVVLLSVWIGISACTPVDQPVEPTALPAPVDIELPDGVIDSIAENLNIGVEQIEFKNAIKIDYPNDCLGLPSAEEVCAEMIVPGYQGIFAVGSAQYEFRSDESGGRLRIIPIALKAAQAELSKAFQIDINHIRWVGVERMEWKDSCLGLEQPGITCAEVITPGFRILLEAGGVFFVYRTNESGSQVVLEMYSN